MPKIKKTEAQRARRRDTTAASVYAVPLCFKSFDKNVVLLRPLNQSLSTQLGLKLHHEYQILQNRPNGIADRVHDTKFSKLGQKKNCQHDSSPLTEKWTQPTCLTAASKCPSNRLLTEHLPALRP